MVPDLANRNDCYQFLLLLGADTKGAEPPGPGGYKGAGGQGRGGAGPPGPGGYKGAGPGAVAARIHNNTEYFRGEATKFSARFARKYTITDVLPPLLLT